MDLTEAGRDRSLLEAVSPQTMPLARHVDVRTSWGDCGFDLPPTLTIIGGVNGAGKTTLLEALGRCLGHESGSKDCAWLERLEILGHYRGQEWRAAWEKGRQPEVTGCLPPTEFVDAAKETSAFLDLNRGLSSEELTNGVDAYGLEGDELKLISFLVGRDYSSAQVFELGDSDSPQPFFRAQSSRGAIYDSRGMGRGELVAFYLVWRLCRVAMNSIVFLEEPESHLFIPSQEALRDVLIALAARRKSHFLVSTHSPALLDGLNAVVWVDNQASVLLADNAAVVTDAIERREPMRVQVAVEDSGAAAYLRAIIKHYKPHLLRHLTIWRTKNGDSDLRVLRGLKFAAGSTRSNIFIFPDGDQRTSEKWLSDPEPERQRQRLPSVQGAFLPGHKAPELVLQDAVHVWFDSGQPAPEVLGTDDARLRKSLGKVEGKDHHDWLRLLARDLEVSEHHLFGAFIPSMESRAEWSTQIQELIRLIEQSLAP